MSETGDMMWRPGRGMSVASELAEFRIGGEFWNAGLRLYLDTTNADRWRWWARIGEPSNEYLDPDDGWVSASSYVDEDDGTNALALCLSRLKTRKSKADG